MSVTVAVPVIEPLLAVTVQLLPLAGAVNRPEVLIVPPLALQRKRRLSRHRLPKLVQTPGR